MDQSTLFNPDGPALAVLPATPSAVFDLMDVWMPAHPEWEILRVGCERGKSIDTAHFMNEVAASLQFPTTLAATGAGRDDLEFRPGVYAAGVDRPVPAAAPPGVGQLAASPKTGMTRSVRFSSSSYYGAVMSTSDADVQMHVGTLYRYPVKSMLGEAVGTLFVDEQGVEDDRRLALIDEATGRVASAKQARLWRALLTCSASVDAGRVSIRMPDGVTMTAEADEVDARLSELLARQVHLAHTRPPGASVERADPEQVLEFGLDAEVDAPLLELTEATPGASFTDYAPVHAITTATLERIDIEAERYRPNLVIVVPPGYPAYAENEWTGRTLAVGQARLRALGPTPRCVIPTLEHGQLGRAPQALRTPAVENRVAAMDMGVLPCAGAYFEVVAQGTIQVGDRVTLGES